MKTEVEEARARSSCSQLAVVLLVSASMVSGARPQLALGRWHLTAVDCDRER